MDYTKWIIYSEIYGKLYGWVYIIEYKIEYIVCPFMIKYIAE